METKEWHTTDKSAWDDGPWKAEPDKVQWPDADTGLPCLMVRNSMGVWCGYVGVPREHPLHGRGCDDKVKVPDAILEAERSDTGFCIISAVCQDAGDLERGVLTLDLAFDVHGGLNFARECSGKICHEPGEGEPEDVWWFGFDCNHAGDLMPMRGPGWPRLVFEGDVYRDRAYVEGEVSRLAKQLVEAATWAKDAGAEGG